MLKNITFDIECKLVRACKPIIASFQQRPLEYLGKKYDEESRISRLNCSKKGRKTNV